MAQFSYTALNQTGKKLSGLISAANAEEARKQLNVLGVSLLTLEQSAETQVQTSTAEPDLTSALPKFEFEAFDKSGKKILGTIPASSRYRAFQRLVEEYGFEVAYVVSAGSSEEEKENAKKEDLTVLKAEYEREQKAQGKGLGEEKGLSAEFEKNRLFLLKKVDFVLEKIKSILVEYQSEIKPENRRIIQDNIDKLLRIKSSTNLDYIQHSSEELLKKVQDQELFLHKEKMAGAQSKVQLETRELMSELHTKPVEFHGLGDSVEKVIYRLDKSPLRLLKAFSTKLKTFLPTTEEKELRSTLKAVNQQVWTFRKIWFTTPKMAKDEAYKALLRVMEEKKRLQAELRDLQRKKKKAYQALQGPIIPEGPLEPLILDEIRHFFAWLLGFYLIAYFLSYYVTGKIFASGNPLPGDFNLLSSPTLKVLLISLFVWFCLLHVRLSYFRYQKGATGLVLLAGIVLNAGLVFNL